MNSKGKYIGLNQRIPFEVLNAAIDSYLERGAIDRVSILQDIRVFTSGVNRASKATGYIVRIITRQADLLNRLKKALDGIAYRFLQIDDRKSLCLCLICLTYPITYDLLVALAQGFKVQDQINKKFISEKLKSIYGSNRTVDVAIDAMLPMLIELGTIKRVKISIYSHASRIKISNVIISELIVYTDIRLHSSKSILVSDLAFRPWYTYFEIFPSIPDNLNQFVIKKESAVGMGYLKIVDL